MAGTRNRGRRSKMRQQLRQAIEKRCGKLFETGDNFKYWSNVDFVCSNLNCSDRKCKDGMIANVEYGCNEILFEKGTQLGEGGFGKVFQYPFHQQAAAFKKTPIYFENGRENAMKEAYQEYNIMKTISKKPNDGDDMLRNWKRHYEDGMEELIISPLGCFYIEDIASGQVWMVLILPKMRNDLNKIKRNGKLDEDNIKSIMKQLSKVMIYLFYVRGIRHQDVKPENVLLDYVERNKKITNITVLFTHLNYRLFIFRLN